MVWHIYSHWDKETPHLRLLVLAASSLVPTLAEQSVPFPSGRWQEPRSSTRRVARKAQCVPPLLPGCRHCSQ